MTEYDYSPEGYQRYLETQRRISKWVDNTNAHAPEFRSPFGARSDVQSQSSSNNPERSRSLGDRSRRERSLPPAAVPSGSNARLLNRRERSPSYTSGMRRSYPHSPPNESAPVIPSGTNRAVSSSQHRRSQSLASRPQESHSRTHYRDVDIPHSIPHGSLSHGYNSPRRSSTLSAVQNQQSTSASHAYTHTHTHTHTHTSHRSPPASQSQSYSQSQSHHRHSRSHSTPRPRSSTTHSQPLYISDGRTNTVTSPPYAVIDNTVYTAKPGEYIIIPPKGRKVNIVVSTTFSSPLELDEDLHYVFVDDA